MSLNLAARRSPPWEVNHAQRFAVLEVANRFEYSQLLAQGFRIGVDPDLTLLLRDPAAALRTVPGFGCYRTVEETLASIDQLVATRSLSQPTYRVSRPSGQNLGSHAPFGVLR